MNTQRERVAVLIAMRERDADGFKEVETRFYTLVRQRAVGTATLADWPECWYALVDGVLERWQRHSPAAVDDVVDWVRWGREDPRLESLVEVLSRRGSLGAL